MTPAALLVSAAMALDLDRLVPESVRAEGGEAVRRARVLVIVNLIVTGVAGYISWVQFVRGSPTIGYVTAFLAGASLLSLLILYVTGAWRVLGAIASAFIFMIAGGIVAATGGAMPAANFYLCLVPLVATLILGARWGAGAAVLAIAFLTGVEWLRRDGFEFPLHVSAEVAAQSRYRGAILFEIILFIFAVVYDLLRTYSLRDVAESEARYRAFSVQRSGERSSFRAGWRCAGRVREPGALLVARLEDRRRSRLEDRPVRAHR